MGLNINDVDKVIQIEYERFPTYQAILTLSEQRAKNYNIITVELLPNGIGEEAVGCKQFLGHCCSELTDLRGKYISVH